MLITDIHKISKMKNHYIIQGFLTFVSVMAFLSFVLKKRNTKQQNKKYLHYKNNETVPTPLIVITGCDTGLGYSIVMRYLTYDNCNESQNYNNVINLQMFNCKQIVPKHFAIVAFCLNPQGPGAKKLLQLALTNHKIKLFVRQLDLTDKDSIKNGVDFVNALLEYNINENEAHDKYELHALVNNAANMVMAEYEWQTTQMIQRQFEVNVLGPMFLTAQMLPKLRKYKSRVINVISHCAYLSLPGISIYGATKSAVRAWSVGLRVELENHGVQVITFLPGSFYFHSSIMSGQQRKIDYNQMRENMNNEQLMYYGTYFDAYQNYLSTIDPFINRPEITIPRTNKIYREMDNALWTIPPKVEYSVPEPWRYRIYYSLAWTLSLLGLHYFRDKVVREFVATPNFQNYVVHQEENT